MDVLATAMGKLDNPGRVKGVSEKVSAKKFFGKKRRTKAQKAEPQRAETIEEIEARVYARLSKDFQSKSELLTSQLEAAQESRDLSQQKV